MKILDVLFPDIDRNFPGLRWVNILLRTTHLVGVAGIGAACLYNIETRVWLPYLGLTIISGSLMMGLSIWSNAIWLLQLRGIAMLAKLLLLSLCLINGGDTTIFITVIVISGIISHAPGKLRYYPVFRIPSNYLRK